VHWHALAHVKQADCDEAHPDVVALDVEGEKGADAGQSFDLLLQATSDLGRLPSLTEQRSPLGTKGGLVVEIVRGAVRLRRAEGRGRGREGGRGRRWWSGGVGGDGVVAHHDCEGDGAEGGDPVPAEGDVLDVRNADPMGCIEQSALL
jgi:hypothetical protein